MSEMPAHNPCFFQVPDGRKLAYDRYGDEQHQPVVFLHGGGQTRHAWGNSAQRVAEGGFYAITMDHRGHGDSDWHPEGHYEISGFVGDLLYVIDQLSNPPILIGASLGGMTSMLAAAQTNNQCCSGLILVDIAPKIEFSGTNKIMDFMTANPHGFGSLEEAGDVIASYLPHRPKRKDTSGLEKNLRLKADGRWYWHWDPRLLDTWKPKKIDLEELKQFHEHRLAAARQLTIPTMLIRGKLSDVVSEEGAREFLEHVPHAEYVDLEAAGHMVAGDRNDAFCDAVLDFVHRHFIK
jgi:pimeloyl-ACP methyl ester carboxylesterase